MNATVLMTAAWVIFLITCAKGQNNINNYYPNEAKPRISLEFDMPLTELVDTCHSYAEQKAIPLRQRIQQLEDENLALRNGQQHAPKYSRYVHGNSGAQPNQINLCQSNPCRNRGTCQPFVNGVGYKCYCQTNYTGPYCQKRITNGLGFNTGFTRAGNTINNNGNNINTDPNYFYPKSCRDIYNNNEGNGKNLPDTVYSIKPDKNVITVFCNMTAGGWTLVYAYRFTRGGPTMSDFTSQQNAVTPIPNWPIKDVKDRTVPHSTQPPSNETDYNAVDFSLWRHIGREFLIKSNFVNWYHCVPQNGSLVDMKEGSVSCTMTHKLYHSNFNRCFSAPNWFDPLKYSYGPRLGTHEGTYFYWDSSETFNFPVHNPCNSFTIPQNLDFSNPRGAIYLY